MKKYKACCVKEEITEHNASIPIEAKITNRLPFISPQTPQKYAPNIIPKKKNCLGFHLYIFHHLYVIIIKKKKEKTLTQC